MIPGGRVVGIIERIQRNFCGSLKPLGMDVEVKGEMVEREFVPVDNRFPTIIVKLRKV